MEQKEPVLVLYDREEEYARLFSEYLKRQKELPWQILLPLQDRKSTRLNSSHL